MGLTRNELLRKAQDLESLAASETKISDTETAAKAAGAYILAAEIYRGLKRWPDMRKCEEQSREIVRRFLGQY